MAVGARLRPNRRWSRSSCNSVRGVERNAVGYDTDINDSFMDDSNLTALPFIGRERYFEAIRDELTAVRETRAGRFISMRGRRRVGKSRLVEEFLRAEGIPYVFYTASRESLEKELVAFTSDIASSALPQAEEVREGMTFGTWQGALRWLASSSTEPTVVVIDELPYLIEQDGSIEATLQTAWDRFLSRAPVLLIVVGSDLSMMEALSSYDRPLYGRPTKEMVVEPLTPYEMTTMLGIEPEQTFDTFLAIGGFPQIAQNWRGAPSLWKFLERELNDPTSSLVVNGERILRAEFPKALQAADVLKVIGAGERTFSNISGRLEGIPATSLTRSLKTLIDDKRVASELQPLSTREADEPRYIVADTYLRFWLRFVGPHLSEIERGRGDLVLAKIKADWSTYRGKAIEPLIHAAIERLLPDDRFGDTRKVGGYWTRTNDPEVDLVGVELANNLNPKRVSLVGAVKWREREPFKRNDLTDLITKRAQVPGTDDDTLLVGVSRSGFATDGLDVTLSPDDLLDAWRPR